VKKDIKPNTPRTNPLVADLFCSSQEGKIQTANTINGNSFEQGVSPLERGGHHYNKIKVDRGVLIFLNALSV
jgi:hypothetical protein